MNNERMIAVSSDLIERAVSLLDLLPESGTIIELRAALATQPAAGEPVAKYRDRSNHDVIRRDQSQPCYCWAENDHRIGEEVAAPPAAAHGDEAVRNIESAAMTLAACMDYPWEHMTEQGRKDMRKHARRVIDAAMRAQGEEGGRHD